MSSRPTSPRVRREVESPPGTCDRPKVLHAAHRHHRWQPDAQDPPAPVLGQPSLDHLLQPPDLHRRGVFGDWRSPKTENVRRSWTFIVGIVKTSLMVACVTAAANLRLLRKWAVRVCDHTDPLTALDPDDPGFDELSPDAGGAGILWPPLAA